MTLANPRATDAESRHSARRRAGVLRLQWEQAYGAYVGASRANFQTLRAAEHIAYDELTDYLEANGLTRSGYDPRYT